MKNSSLRELNPNERNEEGIAKGGTAQQMSHEIKIGCRKMKKAKALHGWEDFFISEKIASL